ncbi:protein phosphatase 2C domain-containing protein [Mycobacterium sp.]|uniref:protein phosphatase 2C domain-containing protein n=1 Tax=Mycobacterium sp. TaxID=1785 RepID=UPI002D5BC542|nr:protein phosphatase 2C domain-containing protein [Mycobacterium sp.]HZA12269.1 protein phosphatase 2C domain-containing protein [Mycobacterium sp.]
MRDSGLIGRNLARASGVGQRVILADETLSRTHLEFGVAEGTLWIRDCGSTNGSDIETDGRRRHPVGTSRRTPVPPGSTIYLGRRYFRVEATLGRAVIAGAVLDWGTASHVGSARRHNQDSSAAEPPVFMVADGMGGHAAGDLASRAVVDALLTLAGRADVTRQTMAGCLTDARARMARIPVRDRRSPGSTVSGVIVTGGDDAAPSWLVVNVGDSRTYRWDCGGLRQLTVDHSVAQGLIDSGTVTPSAARGAPMGNVLTRAVQAHADCQPDTRMLPIRPGDRILVCSDGLTRELDEATIGRVLAAHVDPQAVADALVGAVVTRGGQDDATAVVVDAIELTRS